MICNSVSSAPETTLSSIRTLFNRDRSNGHQPKWLGDRWQDRGDPVLMDGGMGTDAKRIFTDLAAEIFAGSVPSAHVGIFSLTPNDVDFLGLGPVVAGDVITAVTTPLEDGIFQVPIR